MAFHNSPDQDRRDIFVNCIGDILIMGEFADE